MQGQQIDHSLAGWRGARLRPLSGPAAGGSLIFCPDIGGNVFYARPIVQGLSNVVACFGLNLAPDMVDRLDELPVSEIIDRFAEDILAGGLEGPLHILGYSFGGYFAVEVTRRLTELGAAPDRVWILDVRPTRPIRLREVVLSPALLASDIARFAWKNRRRYLGLGADPAILHRFRLASIDLSRHPDSYRGIIRHFYTTLAGFEPGRWDGSATVVVAEDHRRSRGLPDDLGWSDYITEVDVVKAPGDHLSMLRTPENAAHVAAHIRSRILRERDSVH